jgi:hypothetical protein
MRLAIVPLVLIGLAVVAEASEIGSAYSDIDLDECKKIAQAQEGEGEWTQWQCQGYGGIAVRVTEDDLRFTVSLGPNAENQCAARQSFNKFNTLGPRIEWRIEDGKPFATILRWYQNADGEKSNWLVVSKFDGSESCQIAYIDPAMPDANTLARQYADQKAKAFNCSKDIPQIVSNRTMELSELVMGAPCTSE